MKSLLSIKNIKVENANAIAGLTYGFPAVSNFLGFTHALSRALNKKLGLSLGGCAIICHQHHVQAYQPAGWGDYVFALTRNPLVRDKKTGVFTTAPFNEEGRMHMEVSLLIECNFHTRAIELNDGGNPENKKAFEDLVLNQSLSQRLAGGTITNIGSISFDEVPQDAEDIQRFTRKKLLKLLPGFVLVDRSELLREHHASNPHLEKLDAWLDFAALKYQAIPEPKDGEEVSENTKARWAYVPKPASGWLVPITTGYKAISPLYEKGEVARTRDAQTPFRFVESIYGVGEWLSPHRVTALEDIIWRYRVEDDWYLCTNDFKTSLTPSIF